MKNRQMKALEVMREGREASLRIPSVDKVMKRCMWSGGTVQAEVGGAPPRWLQ